MISFACEGCGKAFTIPDEWGGRRSRCKGCGAALVVPTTGAVAQPLAPRSAFEAPTPKQVRRKGKKRRGLDRDAWTSLAIGAALAAVALAVPLIGFVVSVLVTVIHELGHVATAWLLASPALPSFDLTFGGGYSHIYARQPLLIALGLGGIAYALWSARDDRPRLIGWGIAALLYGVAISTPLRDLLITAMGHGSELIFAGIFLGRALSGNQVLRAEERPLYAALGLYLILSDARFAANLIRSDAAREVYGDAKGGGHWMDFDLIAADLGWSLPTVASVFLLACLLTPVVTFLRFRFRPR